LISEDRLRYCRSVGSAQYRRDGDIQALLGSAENSIVVPCDHVFDDNAFEKVVLEGLKYTDNSIVTFGITPTHPETGYGYIETNLESFKTAKIEAKLPEEMIAIIAKEQSFLADLHEVMKYPNEQKHILESIDLAYAQKSDQVVNKLDTLVGRALTSGAKTQDEIVSELKNTENLKNTCINLDKELEVHNVQVNLSNFKHDHPNQIPAPKESLLSKNSLYFWYF
jgi:hypothetical protein